MASDEVIYTSTCMQCGCLGVVIINYMATQVIYFSITNPSRITPLQYSYEL